MTKIKKENLVLRIIGLSVFALSIYWFWKTNFDLITAWGIPLPLQIISAAIGFFTLIAPAPFFRVLAVFLPKDMGERFIIFINEQLDHKDTDQVLIKPEDKGEVLADKLNKAIFLSKRRFYIGALIALIIFPLVAIYIFNLKENDKIQKIKDGSHSLLETVQNNRLSFGSFDLFHKELENHKDLANLSSETSTVGHIYKILSQLYEDPNKVNSEIAFRNELHNIYKTEFIDVFDNKAFDRSKIKTPMLNTDPPESKQVLYILLATICSYEGNNGKFPLPHIYGRGILNELFPSNKPLPQLSPNAYNLNGINYSSLLKSIQYDDDLKKIFSTHNEDIKSVFEGQIPSPTSLAMKAKGYIEEYGKLDTTNTGQAKYRNNMVDLYVASIYLAKIKGINFGHDSHSENNFVEQIKEDNLSDFFTSLNTKLNEAESFNKEIYSTLETTRAQLCSLEGEIKQKQPNTDPAELVKIRDDAIKAVKNAIYNDSQTKENFTEANANKTSLEWLWQDVETRRILMGEIK